MFESVQRTHNKIPVGASDGRPNIPALEFTLALIAKHYAGRKDKLNDPIVFHSIRVMQYLGWDAEEELQHIALLHDFLEDTPFEPISLREMGYTDRIVDAVELLTHPDGMSYTDYIERICESESLDAISVKIADQRDNTDLIGRGARLPQEVKDHIKDRYKGVLERLTLAWEIAYAESLD